MEVKRSWLVALPMLFLAGAGPMQGSNDVDSRIAELEANLAEMRIELDESNQLVQQTVEYLKAQASSAKKQLDVLDRSEEAGFTFGINPLSREVLLSGWRAELNARQQGLPAPKKEAVVETVAPHQVPVER